MLFFFFKQKTAYEIKECDWSSDVCSSDLNRKKFGPWQAEKIMEPAAVETMPEARARLERMLDRIATGFNEEGI